MLDKESKTVKLPHGSALSFKCNLTTEHCERFKIKWYFNPNGPLVSKSKEIGNMITYIKRAGESSTASVDKYWDLNHKVLNYTSNAKPENSGWYFCMVTEEVPGPENITSSGTHVHIGKYL